MQKIVDPKMTNIRLIRLINSKVLIEKHEYDEGYFVGGGKSNYDDYRSCSGIIHGLSNMVLSAVGKHKMGPGSYCDVGCAYGFGVEWFHARKIPSCGFDISEWAVRNAPESVREFVRMDRLPTLKMATKYDLVTCYETLEHIPFEDLERSIERLYEITERCLIIMPALSTTDNFGEDKNDATHVSVMTKSWWEDTLVQKGYNRHMGIEEELNTHRFSQGMGWSGRFFAIIR